MGENLHSIYLQRLFELCVRLDLADRRQKREGLVKIPKLKITTHR